MRLISFLGVGPYSETTYTFNGKVCRTQYVGFALASFQNPKQIQIIATTEAWDKHGKQLSELLRASGHPDAENVWIPTTGESENLWKIFGTIVKLIQNSQDDILFDITHGIRAHPFFASSCIQYVQSVSPESHKTSVVYGEYRKDEQESPIWELTPFLEVLSWSRNLMMFLQTGKADKVVAPTITLGRELKKEWAKDRSNPQPGLENLGKALEAFGDDFTTIRTGSLLIGRQPSAQRLWDAIERTRDEVAQQLPALALVLDQVRAMVEPLRTGEARLSSAEGQRVLLALARLYQSLGRYSEAISVLREGWITLGAPRNTDQPGTDEFQDEWRERVQENIWRLETRQSKSVGELRNDIQHAGFKKDPKTRKWFEEQLTTLLNQWQASIDSMADRHPE